MKRVLAIICTLALLLSALPLTMAADVIEIDSKAELCAIADNLSGNYRLTADIVFTSEDFAEGGEYYNNGKGFAPIGTQWAKFTGVFDGNGHSIVGLKMDVTSGENNKLPEMGLFGYATGTIKNVRLYDINYSLTMQETQASVDNYNIGGLVGIADKASIENCAVYGQISASATNSIVWLGGLVGQIAAGKVENCAAYVTLSATRQSAHGFNVGGLIGYVKNDPVMQVPSNISHCFAVADLNATDHSTNATKDIQLGALVGKCTASQMSECYYIEGANDAVSDLSANSTVTDCLAVQSTDADQQEMYENFSFSQSWKMGIQYPVLKNLLCLDHVRDLICDICGADVEGVLPPVITSQPTAQRVPVGETAILSTQVTGEDITYRWYAIDKASENLNEAYMLSDNTVYSGTATNTLQIDTSNYPFCEIEPLDYYYVAFNSGGQVMSARVSVTVDHKAAEQITTVIPSTCEVAGTGKKICTVCGEDAETGIALPLTDHTPSDEITTVIPSTCEVAGVGKKICTVCGQDAETGITLPLASHNYGAYVYNNDATTTKDGTKTRTCSACGDKETVTAKGTKLVPKNPFKDVKEKAYYYDAVLWAVENGVTNGTSPTTFSPEETCTRGQIVTFLWRAAGEPAPKSSKNPFKDVGTKDYYYKAVLWAVEKDITNGTSPTTFSPGETCTRGQVATFLYRAEGSPSIAKNTKNPFKDVSSKAYYYKAVLWAVKEEITNGTSPTTFGPDETCTRGQIATFLYRNYN